MHVRMAGLSVWQATCRGLPIDTGLMLALKMLCKGTSTGAESSVVCNFSVKSEGI